MGHNVLFLVGRPLVHSNTVASCSNETRPWALRVLVPAVALLTHIPGSLPSNLDHNICVPCVAPRSNGPAVLCPRCLIGISHLLTLFSVLLDDVLVRVGLFGIVRADSLCGSV